MISIDRERAFVQSDRHALVFIDRMKRASTWCVTHHLDIKPIEIGKKSDKQPHPAEDSLTMIWKMANIYRL